MIYRLLASSVDALHAAGMLLWGLGLPLLVWHRFRRLSHAYMLYALVFVAVTLASHFLLGECVLTTLARKLWVHGGGYRDEIPFTALLANTVAGIRPDRREVVLLWEVAIFATSAGSVWCWLRTRKRPTAERKAL